MTNASIELENIGSQIADLRKLWNELASQGKHADAVGVENEIAALERSSARYEIQHQAERNESARRLAVEAANATLEQIEKHKEARIELENLVVEMEEAAKATDAAMARLGPAFSKCLASWPHREQFEGPGQQEAYDKALGANKYPQFDPLRLRLRLPLILDILRQRGNRGLNEILQAADARF